MNNKQHEGLMDASFVLSCAAIYRYFENASVTTYLVTTNACDNQPRLPYSLYTLNSHFIS